MKRRRLDSDDDEDEHVGAVEGPLNRYATAGSDRDVMLEMGVVTSSSTSRASSQANVLAGLAAAERCVGGRENGGGHEEQTGQKSPSTVWLSSQVKSDLDVPEECLGLLSDALLCVYQAPLLHVQLARPANDRLLAQYLPLDASIAASGSGVPYNVAFVGREAAELSRMCEPPFSRAEERRMRELERKTQSEERLTEEEVAELGHITARYQVFIAEGQRRLREGATQDALQSSPPATATMSESLAKVGKAAYFWTSLVATAVPGYLGRKAGVTNDFHHWNFIVDHLILGALPVVTQVGSSGNHLVVLKEQLDARAETLGMVVACLEEEEMSGFGINVIQFAKEADWRKFVQPNLAYVRLPMEDTTAKVPFEAVARTVDAMYRCIDQQKRAVYVHCKAGKGRSWMTVMCYLVSFGGMSYDEAEALVAKKREQVNPSISQQCFAREFPLRFAKWHSLQDTRDATAVRQTPAFANVDPSSSTSW